MKHIRTSCVARALAPCGCDGDAACRRCHGLGLASEEIAVPQTQAIRQPKQTPPLPATASTLALPRYLTVQQLTETFQCCPQTIRNWCKRGLLPPPLRLGRRKRLWPASAVQSALARLQDEGF